MLSEVLRLASFTQDNVFEIHPTVVCISGFWLYIVEWHSMLRFVDPPANEENLDSFQLLAITYISSISV